MEIRLAENIRAFRKARGLTQEQLAEVMGVTVGAVYKWEARLSLPELNLLIEMADFFDVSVDALLGYEMKDNGLAATVARLEACHRGRDRQGLAVAEKALPYCNIVCITGAELLEKLPGYLSVLYNADPAAVGGAMPDNSFYFA